MVESLLEFFGETIPAEVTVMLLSFIPTIELRGGIIAARFLNLEMWKAFLICGVATVFPTPFILLFIRQIFAWMKNTRFVKFVDRLEEKAEKKSVKINKYKTFGLMLFVAIPLPGTGAWTGALAAALMKMRFSSAMISIVAGTFIADAIMCLIFYGALG